MMEDTLSVEAGIQAVKLEDFEYYTASGLPHVVVVQHSSAEVVVEHDQQTLAEVRQTELMPAEVKELQHLGMVMLSALDCPQEFLYETN